MATKEPDPRDEVARLEKPVEGLASKVESCHAKRLLLTDLFSGYFRGDVPADQLGQRTRQIASRHFMRSAEFYSLAIAAFQGAVDATRARQPHIEEQQKELLRLLAALKSEFGLTDRYVIEGWRAGRE